MTIEEEATTDYRYSTWGLPGTVLWGLLIAAAFVLTQSIVLGTYIALTSADVPSSEIEALVEALQYNATVVSLGAFACLVVCGLMTIGAVKLKKGSNLNEYLGLKTVDLRTVRYWLLALIAFIVLSEAIALMLGRPLIPEFMSRLYQSTETRWMLWLALLVAAPVLEEVFFRGFVISGLKRTAIGAYGAIALSAALWAGIHVQYDLFGMATIFLMGILFGIARIESGSVLLTIGLHAFVNFVATIQVAFSAP